MESNFRHLPSVDRLISDSRLQQLEEGYPQSLIVSQVRQYLEQIRVSISHGSPCPSFDELVEIVYTKIQALGRPSLRPVINATGVVLHTNLGRAPLSPEATAAMKLAAQGFTNLEIALEDGSRGSRQVHIEHLLCQVSGAEAALAVNNNAAAVLLALASLAKGRDVIVSRGQAVEIGGGFRIPDVMRQSGAKLVEVGTTNCTRLADYEQAITPRTAVLLRVHSSNFRIVGFTEDVALEELVQLGKWHNLPVLDDLGSGCLLDTTEFGLDPEPIVQESIAAGAALACFSGDKLLGGPQAGLIVGEKPLIAQIQRHPLARAVRIDKIRIAGLVATLLHYLKGEAESKIPVWRMIATPMAEIEKRAGEWAQALNGAAAIVEGKSTVGGGSLPGSTLPTRLVAIRERGKKGKGHRILPQMAQRLRSYHPPIIGRVERSTLLLDPRTVLPEQDETLIQALQSILPHCGLQ